jgi:hypothetical protein
VAQECAPIGEMSELTEEGEPAGIVERQQPGEEQAAEQGASSRVGNVGEGQSAEGTLNNAKQEQGKNITLLASQLLDRRRMLT